MNGLPPDWRKTMAKKLDESLIRSIDELEKLKADPDLNPKELRKAEVGLDKLLKQRGLR